MSDSFASQLSAFKKSLKKQSETLPSQRRVVKQPEISPMRAAIKRSANGASHEDPRSKRLKADMDSIANMPSSSLSIRMMQASDFIRACDRPVSIDELEQKMGQHVDSQLLKCLANVDRIKYDPMTKTLEYLSLHNIKTAENLLKVLENQPTFQGLSVKQLQDGWNGCLPTIQQLEADNRIIVYKTKKENSPRHIWLNVGGLQVEGRMDEEFYNMWAKVRVPQGPDLLKALEDNGMKPTSVDPDSIKSKKNAPIQQRKQKKPRRGKITNVHMKGILKDYSSKM